MKLVLILVCTVALASAVAGQTPATEKEPAKASLDGSIVQEPSGEPLKKAIIELIGHDQEEGGNYTATSDPEGRYKISGILPGRDSRTHWLHRGRQETTPRGRNSHFV